MPDRGVGFARDRHRSVYQFQTTHIAVEDKPQDPESEELALKRAIATANEQITDIYEQVSKQSGKGQAAIFRAHLALLNDAEIFQEVSTQIEAATVRLGRGNMRLNAARWS